MTIELLSRSFKLSFLLFQGSNFIHILFPTAGYNVLSITTDENSLYNILVSVYTVSFGRQTVVSHNRTQASDTVTQSANTVLSVH